jgi:hypothetical protein
VGKRGIGDKLLLIQGQIFQPAHESLGDKISVSVSNECLDLLGLAALRFVDPMGLVVVGRAAMLIGEELNGRADEGQFNRNFGSLDVHRYTLFNNFLFVGLLKAPCLSSVGKATLGTIGT